MSTARAITKAPVSIFKSSQGRQRILNQYYKLLSQFDFEYTERYIETSYGSTYVIESGGQGSPPLLLFHGSTSNSAAWFADFKELTRHFRVVAVDLIGDAGHSAETRLDMRSDGYAIWISELFESMGIQRATIMGNSLGAWMCLKFASVFPQRVDKVVLLAASGIAPVRLSFVLQLVLYSMRGGRGAAGITRMVYGNDRIPPEVLDYIDIISANYAPFTGQIPVLKDSEMIRLEMPVLYIAGEDDKLTHAPKCAQRLLKLLPRPTIHLLKDRGHVVYDVLHLIVPFLQQQDNAG
ncbi:MAG: alpha/beta hydrolase [Syntrophomonas sp.]|nr:alpha/beta hydrolase [Syntrophomonas sp.]